MYLRDSRAPGVPALVSGDQTETRGRPDIEMDAPQTLERLPGRQAQKSKKRCSARPRSGGGSPPEPMPPVGAVQQVAPGPRSHLG